MDQQEYTVHEAVGTLQEITLVLFFHHSSSGYRNDTED
jgi:hypothetical protein